MCSYGVQRPAFLGVCRLEYDFCHGLRGHAVLFIVLHHGHSAVEGFIYIASGVRFFPCGGEACTNVPGLHSADLYAEGTDFIAKGKCQGVYSCLSRGIEGLVGYGYGRGHGAEVDDAAAGLSAHLRQHRLYTVECAVEVHLELGVGIGRVGKFHRP